MANSALSLHGPIGVQDNRNELINGDFNIWQRGLTVGVSLTGGGDSLTRTQNSFIADRWRIYSQAVSGVTAPPLKATRALMPLGFPSGADRASKWYLNILVGNTTDDMGNSFKDYGGFTGAGSTTNGTFTALVQDIGDVNTLEGKTCILSFWAKSDITNQRVAPVLKQCFAGRTAGDTPSLIKGSTGNIGFTLDNTWRQYKTSFNVPSVEGQPAVGTSGDDALQVQLVLHSNGVHGATIELGGPLHVGGTGNISFSQIQLEQGSKSTEFDKTNPVTEVALCQRYYEKTYDMETALGTDTGFAGGIRAATDPSINNTCHQSTTFMTPKRAQPTVVLYSKDGTTGSVFPKHSANYQGTNQPATAGGISESGIAIIVTDNDLGNHTGGDTLIVYHYTADAELSVETN